MLNIEYQLAIFGYRILSLKEHTYIANQLLTIYLDCIQLSNINPRLSSLDYRLSTIGFEFLSTCPFHLQSGELALLRAHLANILLLGSIRYYFFFFLVFGLSNLWYFLNVFHIFVWIPLSIHLLSFSDMYIYIHIYTFTYI